MADKEGVASEKPHDEHEHEPRWDVIEKLHDKLDDDIDEAYRVNRLSFIEVDIALLMIREKIQQQKMELYNVYFKQKENGETDDEKPKDAPANLYK